MKQPAPTTAATMVKIALATALIAAVTGVAFASWMRHGATIFLATVEAGIAWCF